MEILRETTLSNLCKELFYINEKISDYLRKSRNSD